MSRDFLKKITIFGAGTMGQSIALYFLQNSISVELSDISEDLMSKAKNELLNKLENSLKKGRIPNSVYEFALDNLKFNSFENLDQKSDLVIEAIIENMEIKKKLLKKIDKSFSENSLIASNTSSLSINELSKCLTDKRKKQFFGLHFFNPAFIMRLVEFVPTKSTRLDIFESLKLFFSNHEKVIVHCKDVPGFIVNRIARNYYGESFRIIESENSNKIPIIDKVLREVYQFKMGPFELMDLIGIDVNFKVTKSMYESYYQIPRYRPHVIQESMVKQNKLGRKTKIGFYDYRK